MAILITSCLPEFPKIERGYYSKVSEFFFSSIKVNNLLSPKVIPETSLYSLVLPSPVCFIVKKIGKERRVPDLGNINHEA